MKKIVLIILYYGEFPWYFCWFLHTCRYNRDIDFLIVSGSSFEGSLPPNVTILPIPIEEIKALIAEKLGLEADLRNPYKLCDWKPAYGLLLSGYIGSYDFWGYCDIDIIFGNIRNFLTDELLEAYDIITVLADFLAGYFTIYRNSPRFNRLFMASKDFRRVFTSGEHFCFDECNFLFAKLDEGLLLEDIACDIESMTHVVRKLQRERVIRVYFDTVSLQGLGGKLKWDKGTLVYRNRYEIMLYHLIQLKEIFKGRRVRKIPESFRISTTKIY